MAGRPLVSAIITCYNKERYLRQAAESVLSQTERSLELILIDDASTDATRDVIRQIEAEDPERVRTFYHAENQGLTRTWKEVVEYARGLYIARLDADDYWTSPQKLEKQLALLAKSPDSLWSNTDFAALDENDNVLDEACFASGRIAHANTFEKMLASRGFTNPSTWLVETSFMLEATRFISPEAVDDSFEMQLYMLLRTRLATVPEPLAANRFDSESDSRSESLEKKISRHRRLQKTQFRFLALAQDSAWRSGGTHPARTPDYDLLLKELFDNQEILYEAWFAETDRLISERERADAERGRADAETERRLEACRALDVTRTELENTDIALDVVKGQLQHTQGELYDALHSQKK